MNAEQELRLRRWLDARDPGDPPASLRATISTVPDRVGRPALPGFLTGLDRLLGAAETLRWAWLLAVIAVILAAVAVVGAGLLRIDSTPRFPRGLLAYTAPDGSLWVVAADGSGARALTTAASTTTPAVDSRARWSPDGRTVLFTRFSGSPAADECTSFANSSLMLLDIATSVERVLVTRHGPIFAADWSPDGKQIAFLEPPVACKAGQLPRSAGGAVVDVVNGKVSSVPASSGSSWLEWTGTSIAFVWSDHLAFAASATPSSGSALPIILTYGGPGWAVPSPDGQLVALSKGLHDVSGHVVVEDRPSGRRVDLGLGGAPVWSPDGRSIAFFGPAVQGDLDGSLELRVANTSDWQPKTVAKVLIEPTQQGQLVSNVPDLSWSADGRAIYWLDFLKGHIVDVATGRTDDLPASLKGCADLQWQPLP